MAKTVSYTAAAIPVLNDVVPRKSTIPVLQGIRVFERDGQKIAQATDLDLSVEVRVNDDTAPGLYQIIGKELVPAQGFKIENFPMLPFDVFQPRKGAVILGTDTIARLLPFISSKEASRYTLQGASLAGLASGEVRVASTDGHRMVIENVHGDNTLETGNYLIPRNTLKVVLKAAKKLKDVMIEVGGALDDMANTTFRITTGIGPGLGTYICRGMTGQFPNNYEAVLPNTLKHQVSVATPEYIAALKEIEPFTDERSGCVRFTDKGGHFELFAKNNAGYEKTVKLPYLIHGAVNYINGKSFLAGEGSFIVIQMPMQIENHTYEPVLDDDGNPVIGEGGKPLTKRVENEAEFGLNINYLTDTAKVAKSDRLYIGWKDATSAFMFTPVLVPESWAKQPETQEAVAAA